MRKEPFKPARCSDGLEKEIKVGLKTMVKRKKSEKKKKKETGKSRRGREESNKAEIMNEK